MTIGLWLCWAATLAYGVIHFGGFAEGQSTVVFVLGVFGCSAVTVTNVLMSRWQRRIIERLRADQEEFDRQIREIFDSNK